MNYGQIIAKANSHEEIVYEEFGDYQGDWIAITKRDDKWFVWKGCYGSCSGCDSVQSFESDKGFDWNGEWTLEDCKEFAKDYESFIEVDDETWKELLNKGELKMLMPANTRLGFSRDYDDVEDSVVWKEIETKLKEHNEIKGGGK